VIDANHPERPAFEAWIGESSARHLDQITSGPKSGHYRDPSTNWAWEAWLKRASLDTEVKREP